MSNAPIAPQRQRAPAARTRYSHTHRVCCWESVCGVSTDGTLYARPPVCVAWMVVPVKLHKHSQSHTRQPRANRNSRVNHRFSSTLPESLVACTDAMSDDSTAKAPAPNALPVARMKIFKPFAAVTAATHLVSKKRFRMPFGDIQMTVLMHACATGNAERVRVCLDAIGTDQDVLTEELTATDDWASSTPLHWAAFGGNVQVVQALLAVEARVDAPNQRDGSLPIHLAARYGKTACLICLADDARGRKCVNAKNLLGNTPLHEAAYEGRADCAEALLNRGATVERPNGVEKGGLTPLLAAVEYGRAGVVEVLLRHGASMHIAPSDPTAIKPPRLTRKSQLSATSFLSRRRSDLGRRSSRRVIPLAEVSDGDTNRNFNIPGEPAISLALSATHLHVALELILWRMRKGSGAPVIFTPHQLRCILFDIWALEGVGSMSINVGQFTKLFTVLLLCAVPQEPDAALQELSLSPDPRSKRGSRHSLDKLPTHADRASTNEALRPQLPQNPVLLALQLASHCASASQVPGRNRLVNERISDAAILLEHIASGFLECAARAAVQAQEQKQYNPWRMGTEQLHPESARDLFVNDCLEHAAEHELKIFIAHPLVFGHLHELFWPTSTFNVRKDKADADDQLDVEPPSAVSCWTGMCTGRLITRASMVIINVAMLPLLPFIPLSLEHELDETFRLKVVKGELPFGIVWVLPAGRFFSWFCSAFTLACVITSLPPVPLELGWLDVIVALFAIAWAHSEWNEVLLDIRKYGRRPGLEKYFRDPFNLLDVSMIVVMVLLLVARATTAALGNDANDAAWSGPGSEQEAEFIQFHNASSSAWHSALAEGMSSWGHMVHDGVVAAEVPCQAVLVLVAWLRIMEVLFIFPSSGPLLLMAIRMLQDLVQFLTLFSFVVVAFGCSFYVLLSASLPVGADGPTEVSKHVRGDLQIRDVVRWLVQGTLKGESDFVIEKTKSASPISWALMFLFGVIVVLLLLNLLIARFAKTFDMVYENVEHNFKVAFARVVIDGCNKPLVPPPFSLLRSLALSFYRSLVASGLSTTLSDFVLRHMEPCLPQVLVDWLRSDDEHADARGPSDMLHAYQSLGVSSLPRRSSSTSQAQDPGEDDTAKQVERFLRKAADAQVALLPESVVDYVLNHQHDVAREERWRTVMQKELSTIEMQLRKGSRETAMSTTAQAQRLERAVAEIRGPASDGQRARVRDLEATVSALTRQLDIMQMERHAESERVGDGGEPVLRRVRTPTSSPPPDFSFGEFAEEDALYAGTLERAAAPASSTTGHDPCDNLSESSVPLREHSTPQASMSGAAPPPIFTSRSSEF